MLKPAQTGRAKKRPKGPNLLTWRQRASAAGGPSPSKSIPPSSPVPSLPGRNLNHNLNPNLPPVADAASAPIAGRSHTGAAVRGTITDISSRRPSPGLRPPSPKPPSHIPGPGSIFFCALPVLGGRELRSVRSAIDDDLDALEENAPPRPEREFRAIFTCFS